MRRRKIGLFTYDEMVTLVIIVMLMGFIIGLGVGVYIRGIIAEKEMAVQK